MLSAWRKLTKKQDERTVFPSGIAPVEPSMQKKFAKGVQYNLKIIIKGDRNTGKSTLLRRLCGDAFKEEYIPTHEIQVANINWNYRGAVDVVKVEVWDIVDKSSKKRTPSGSLKISNDDESAINIAENDQFSLDAELINVYQGTHGVILTMDITKAWTWKYVQRELEKIPSHIPVLVLGNFRDIGDHRVVQTDEMVAFVEHFDRPTGSAEIYFSESSMKDGFGLKFIYKFINMPFLILQRETLMKQLKANALEIEDMREALALNTGSEDQNYNLFHEMLNNQMSPTLSPLQSPDQEKQQLGTESTPETIPKSIPIEVKPDRKQPPVATVPPTVHNKTPVVLAEIEIEQDKIPSNHENVDKPLEPAKAGLFRSYKEKLFGSSNADKEKKETTSGAGLDISTSAGEINKNIDDFNPGSLDEEFLSNPMPGKSQKSAVHQNKRHDSDSEEELGNPMVAAYEDLSSDSDDNIDMKLTDQLSLEAEFDDLSDDERPQLQVADTSIIEQVKKEKKKTNVNIEPQGDYDVFPDDIQVEYEDVQEGNFPNNISKSSVTDDDHATVMGNTSQHHSDETVTPVIDDGEDSLNVEKDNVVKVNKSDDESDNEVETQQYIVAGDVDVVDDWLDDNKSNNDDDQIDTNINNKQAGDKVNTDSKDDDGGTEQTSSIAFDMDALEMFMTNQMKKTSISTVDEVDVPQQAEKPKKKKKKKVVTEETEGATAQEKPKRKKKTSRSDETMTTKKKESTKTKKSKVKDESDSGVVTQKKIKKKKQQERSELDAFLDS